MKKLSVIRSKYLSFIVTVIGMTLLLNVTVFAEDQFTFNTVNEGTEIEITGCTGTFTSLAIPEQINGIPVTSIADNAFKENATLISVSIPDSVKMIGKYAFCGCERLKTVDMGSGVEKIDDYAFNFDDKLKNITLPDSVKYIGEDAFLGCWSMPSVNLKSVTYIGQRAFGRCEVLEEVTIPDTLTELKDGTFYGCPQLKKVVFPDTMTKIGTGVFDTSHELDYDLPKNLEYLGEGAFVSEKDCIVLPESLEHIGQNAVKANRIILNSKLIDGCVFGNDVTYCATQTQVDLCEFEEVVYIGPSASRNIGDMTISVVKESESYTGEEIKPGITVKYEDDSAKVVLREGFDYELECSDNTNPGLAKVVVKGINFWTGTKEVSFKITGDLENEPAVVNLEYEKVLYDGTAKKPKAVVKFGETALEENKDYSLSYTGNTEAGMATAVIVGIGNYSGTVSKGFEIYKYNLQSAEVTADQTSYTYDGKVHKPGINVKYDGTVLKEGTDYKVKAENTVEVGKYTVAIDGMGLYDGKKEVAYTINAISIDTANVTLNNSIFAYDGSAKKPEATVNLNGNLLTKDVDYLISYKDNINEGVGHVIIRGTNHYDGQLDISFKILPYQSGMDAVYKDEDTLIDDDYVYHITDLEEKEVEFAAPADKKATKVVVPATIKTENGDVFTVTSIGEKAFYKNSKIQSLEIANAVKSIENYAFYGCKNLTSIKIGDGIEIIGDSAFRKCTKLTSVTLPKSIDKLGVNAFYGCKKLKLITIKSKQVVDVQRNAIKNVSKKCVIKVPKKLVKKYKNKFSGKSGFEKGMKIKKI